VVFKQTLLQFLYPASQERQERDETHEDHR
jgi:hypothetical protein